MSWVTQILMLVLSEATPEVRELLCKSIAKLAETAKTTTNPWDDLLALFLKGIMSCDG